ncbi:MAG: hypothetical protein WEA24_04545 [Gemmatimonadota bacterium]
MQAHLTPAVVTLMLAACGAADSPTVAVEVRDSAGITIVGNRGAGWDSAAAWEVAEEPLLVLGAEASTPAHAFTYVMAGARLSDGRIVVAEGTTQDVRYFAADGSHLLTSGGQGQGPGEFRSVGTLVRLPGDSLAVTDVSSGKVVIFGPDGAFAEAITMDRGALSVLDGAYLCYQGRWFPDRSRTACVREPGGPEQIRTASGMTHLGPGLVRTFERFVWVDAGLSRSDTLGIYGGIEQFGAEVGTESPYYIVHPLYAWTWVAAGAEPPRFYSAANPSYTIDMAGPGGERRLIRRQGAVRPVTPELREAAWEYLDAREGGRENQRWNRARSQVMDPDSIPAVQGLAVDTEGNLWVKRSHGLEEGPVVHDVFDPEGRFFGAVRLPHGLNVLEIGADYVLGMRLDAMDVPVIELYGLTR